MSIQRQRYSCVSVNLLQITDKILAKHFPGRRVGRRLPWSVRGKRCNMMAVSRLMIHRPAYSTQFSYVLKV